MPRHVLVLGANGRIGRSLTGAFVAAGWRVYAHARRPLVDRPTEAVVPVDVALDDPAAMARAAPEAELAIHAMNPLYTAWDRDLLPLARQAIAMADALGVPLALPGNVYNYALPMPGPIAEDAPQAPVTAKGRQRVALESLLRERAAAGRHCIIVRAGDFFGGPGPGTWLDQAIAKDIGRGRIVYPGPLEVEHTWAYLPDLARVFVAVAERSARLAPFEVLHFPGHAVRGTEFVAALVRAARSLGLCPEGEPKVSELPWTLLRAGGVFVPMWRELARMRYLWMQPHPLSGARLAKLIGTLPCTPLEEALTAALRSLR